MTPTARRVMEKVRQLQPATYEEWVQMMVDAALDEAKGACDEMKRVYLSDEYAVHQPLSSITERAACSACQNAITALQLEKESCA